jgi:hypothetical protein
MKVRVVRYLTMDSAGRRLSTAAEPVSANPTTYLITSSSLSEIGQTRNEAYQ